MISMVIHFPNQRLCNRRSTFAIRTTGRLLKTVQHLSLRNSSTKMIRCQQLKSTGFCTFFRTYWQFTTINLLLLITRTYMKQSMPYLLAVRHGNPSHSHTRVLRQQRMFQDGWMLSTPSGSVIHINCSWRCSRIQTS